MAGTVGLPATARQEDAPVREAMPDTRGMNFYRSDPNLRFTLRRYLDGADWAKADAVLEELGAMAGDVLDALAHEADKNPPVLRTHDRRGQRVDEVVYSAAYRQMEEIAFSRFALAACSHRAGIFGFEGPVPHVLKYALTYLFAQSEFGLLCPVNMTDSLTRVLRLFASPGILEAFLPRLTSLDLGQLWQGAMFLTEQAGGSDVGASETIARPVDPTREPDLPDGLVSDAPLWRLYGDKWFCSNVDAEAILTLARPEGAPPGTRGLGLFLVPRWLPDGSRNRYVINRLKDKLGTRDMATGEVSFQGALAYQVGALERGFRQMVEMINASRLSNAVRSAGMMRRAFLESMVHARGRLAFGRPLLSFPLLRHTLFEMLLDVEGAVSAVFYTADRLQRADDGDASAKGLVRVLTPLLKATVTKRARYTTAEAMEVRGGNGYIEEWVNARLVRDSHLGSIWEGTTNIVQLDVLRAIQRDESDRVLFAEVEQRLAALRNACTAVPPAVEAALQQLLQQLGDRASHLAEACRRLSVPAGDDRERMRQELAVRRLVPDLFHLVAAVGLAEDAVDQLRGVRSVPPGAPEADGNGRSRDRAAEPAAPSGRKLVVAAAYVARYVAPHGADPLDDPDTLELLPSLADWAALAPATAAEVAQRVLQPEP